MELYKFDAAILKILIFGHFMAGNVPKSNMAAIFDSFQNRYIKFVELHTEKLQTKF